MNSDIWFVYDGECPICCMGASLYRVRQNVGAFHAVDARTQKDHPVMHEINQAGLSIDEGMVIKYEGQLYHGKRALKLMAQLGADEGWMNRINNRIFQFGRMGDILYPLMKAGRNIALAVKGVGKIRNLD